MYIFYNDNEIILQETEENDFALVKKRDKFIKFLENPESSLKLEVNNIDSFIDELKNYLNFVEAAGAIIFNEQRELLTIYRRKKWDFPKGKIDSGEIPILTAIRETYEECNLTLTQKNGVFFDFTYHIYYQNNYILKKTHWFIFNIDKIDNSVLKPQLSEEIEKIVFCSKEEWINKFSLNTYRNLKVLVEKLIKNNKW